MTENKKAMFYRLDTLPDYSIEEGKYVGLFVYVKYPQKIYEGQGVVMGYVDNENYLRQNGYPTRTEIINAGGLATWLETNSISENRITSGTIASGLYFGGRLGWELLTNVVGLTIQDVQNWINGNTFNNEADIFTSTSLSSPSVGTEYTIYDVILNSNGISASSDSSDAHTFTVGDGALKIKGSAATTTGQNPTIPSTTTNDVHSANDTSDSTLTLDNSLVWTPSTPSGSVGTIGVRVKTAVDADNPIVTLADIASLNGAMHYKGALASDANWPSTTEAGDVWVVTTGFTHSGTTLEIGDMVVFSNNQGAYNVVQTNMTIGTDDGQIAPVDGHVHWNEDKIVVSTQNGIIISNVGIDDVVTGVISTQEITTGTNSATYTITTAVEKLGNDSDSDVDTHSITLNSLNKSFKITEDTTNADNQINFDLVWLESLS